MIIIASIIPVIIGIAVLIISYLDNRLSGLRLWIGLYLILAGFIFGSVAFPAPHYCRISWISKNTHLIGHGDYMFKRKEFAQEIAQEMDKKYPDLYHWVESE